MHEGGCRMIITKYPDDMDPNYILMKKCMDRDICCPFCGAINEDKDYTDDSNEFRNFFISGYDKNPITWLKVYYYGYQYPKKTNFLKAFITREKKRKWIQIKCRCKKCNAKWIGEPFLANVIGGDIE